jgi:hypothetical protein
MYQLEDISCPQLYPRACICLMMYFKNNWNAGPFFYFMDFLEEKKPFMLTMSKNTNCFKVHLDVEPGPCVYCSKHDISKRYIHLQQRVSDAPEFYKLVSDNFNISENACVLQTNKIQEHLKLFELNECIS